MIKKLSKLVEGPREKFLQAMFKAAKKCKDRERAVRVAKELKDITMAKVKGEELAWRNCRILKDRTAYASELWFGQAEAMKTFDHYQVPSIHSPLTTTLAYMADATHARDLKAKILNNFQTAQKFMGQRNSSRIPLRLHQVRPIIVCGAIYCNSFPQ